MSDVIGKARRRVDGRAKVTGQTRFADDVMLPRMLHCKLLRSPVPHARIVRIDTHARARRIPACHLVLTGDRLPDHLRHPAGQPGRARPVPGQGALRRRPGGRRRRPRRGRRPRPLDLIDVEYEPLPHVSPSPTTACACRAAHPRLRRHGQRPQGRVAPVRRRGRRPSPAPTTCSRTCSSSRATPTCRSSSTPTVAANGSRRQARACGPAPRRRTTSTARSPRCCSMPAAHIRVDRHAQRRRLRRQERSVQPRDRGGQGGAAARPPGEDLPHARGGVLLPPRPPSRADAVQDRGTRTARSRAWTCRRCSTAAPTDATASPARSTRARCRR